MDNRRIDINQDWYLVKYVIESSFEWYVDTRIERYMESATYEFTTKTQYQWKKSRGDRDFWFNLNQCQFQSHNGDPCNH